MSHEPEYKEEEKGLLGHDMPQTQRSIKMRNEWVDGLRGLASLSVLTAHLGRAFDFALYHASDRPDAPMRLLQYPYLRLWPQGRIGVATFGLVTGFVCAIKPIKQIRAGEIQNARDTLGKAAFKRPMRLMLPATIATVYAYLIAQLGFFFVASRVDTSWIRKATPQQKPFLESLNSLQTAMRETWTKQYNYYDDHQWTMLPLLKVSLYSYFTLAAIAQLHFKYRVMTYWLFFLFFWIDSRRDSETFYCNAFFGMFLSDLFQEPSFQQFATSRNWFRRVLSVSLMVVGLLISSYPEGDANWQSWSKAVDKLQFLLPPGTLVMKRMTSMGLMLAVSGVILNNKVRWFLTTWPIQFLAKHSFAVYLTHGSLLKSVLMWMIYGTSGQPWDPENKLPDGHPVPIPRASTGWFFFWVPIWLVIVYVVGWLWTTYVDPLCERISQWVMKKTFQYK